MKPQVRQIRRLEKAIDELIKIQDDGESNENIGRVLEMLNSERNLRLLDTE